MLGTSKLPTSSSIVLMLLHSAMEPGLKRLAEHRGAVRDVIRSAKSELGVSIAEPAPAGAKSAATSAGAAA